MVRTWPPVPLRRDRYSAAPIRCRCITPVSISRVGGHRCPRHLNAELPAVDRTGHRSRDRSASQNIQSQAPHNNTEWHRCPCADFCGSSIKDLTTGRGSHIALSAGKSSCRRFSRPRSRFPQRCDQLEFDPPCLPPATLAVLKPPQFHRTRLAADGRGDRQQVFQRDSDAFLLLYNFTL